MAKARKPTRHQRQNARRSARSEGHDHLDHLPDTDTDAFVWYLWTLVGQQLYAFYSRAVDIPEVLPRRLDLIRKTLLRRAGDEYESLREGWGWALEDNAEFVHLTAWLIDLGWLDRYGIILREVSGPRRLRDTGRAWAVQVMRWGYGRPGDTAGVSHDIR